MGTGSGGTLALAGSGGTSTLTDSVTVGMATVGGATLIFGTLGGFTLADWAVLSVA